MGLRSRAAYVTDKPGTLVYVNAMEGWIEKKNKDLKSKKMAAKECNIFSTLTVPLLL